MRTRFHGRPIVAVALGLLCVTLVVASGRQAAGVAPPHMRADAALGRRVGEAVRAVLRRRNVPGAAVVVMRRDTVLVAAGFGTTDLDRRIPVTTETIFQIASTTKPFTATAVSMLVEEGRVQLDAPASRYLSWLPARYASVTVRQLLAHTSGVAPDMRQANVDEFTEPEFRRRFVERPASFPPGTSWQYANAGYTLLAQLVEAVSGMPFGDYLARRVFEPLGMRRTGYRVRETVDSLHAVGHDLASGRFERAPHVFSGWGNSGIESSAMDLARWAAAVDRGALLRPASYRAMFTPARLAADTAVNFAFRDGRSSYGFGWFLTTYRGLPVVTHGGAIAGFTSIVQRFPTAGWTVIVLSNAKMGADRQSEADVIAAVVDEVIGIAGGAVR